MVQVQQWSACFRRARFAWHGVRGHRAPTVRRRVNLLESRVPVFRGRGCERGSLWAISAGREGRGEPPGESRSKPPARALGLAAGPEARDVCGRRASSGARAPRTRRHAHAPACAPSCARAVTHAFLSHLRGRGRGQEDARLAPGRGVGVEPLAWLWLPESLAGSLRRARAIALHFPGGISEQSLPSPKKRRPACRLWSGDARESRKKRGFGCAPCPWVAEAGKDPPAPSSCRWPWESQTALRGF